MAKKTLSNINMKEAKSAVSDLQVVGNGDLWQLLCKAYSTEEDWLKSTKAMEIENVGCIVQVTTQQGNNVAEAVVFVPSVSIVEDENGGRKLVEF